MYPTVHSLEYTHIHTHTHTYIYCLLYNDKYIILTLMNTIKYRVLNVKSSFSLERSIPIETQSGYLIALIVDTRVMEQITIQMCHDKITYLNIIIHTHLTAYRSRNATY